MTSELVPIAVVELAQGIDRNPLMLYLASMAPGSRPTTYSLLRRLVRDGLGQDCDPELFPWARLRYVHTAAIRSWLADTYAPSTANRGLSALRGVLRHAMRLGLMTRSDYEHATELDPIRGSRELAGRELTLAELVAMFGASSRHRNRAKGARDASMLAMLYGAGLRRAELGALDLGDVDRERRTLAVAGKGNKHRTVHVPVGVIVWLDRYLVHRGSEPGPLYVGTIGRGRALGRGRLGLDAIADSLASLAKRAGIARWSPHDCRRTYIGALLDAGADLATVAKLVGHAQVTTTARYDRRGERAKARAAELVHVPS